MSLLVDHFLHPLLPKLISYIKDTTDFMNRLNVFRPLPAGTWLDTAHVNSLYTNIRNLAGIDAVLKFLLLLRSPLPVPKNSTLIELLELVLTLNNFQFNGNNYLVIGGTAMGTKVPPQCRQHFYGRIRRTHVYRYHLQWVTFIQYVMFLWQHADDELDNFKQHLN